jgi:hypothetical protein
MNSQDPNEKKVAIVAKNKLSDLILNKIVKLT